MGKNVQKLITLLAVLCMLLFAFGTTVLAEETATDDTADSLVTDGDADKVTDGDADKVTDGDADKVTDGDADNVTDGDVPEEPVPVFSMGDLDSDGTVSANEARRVLRSSVGLEALESDAIVYADADFSGNVSAADARAVLRVAVSLDVAVAHHFVIEATTDATCTAEGSVQYSCLHCELTGAITTPILPHNYKTDSHVDPTCTEKGYEKSVCTDCGHSVTKEIKATGHDFEIVNRVEPTCIQEGRLDTRCKKCSATFSSPIKKTGHEMVRCTATQPQYCSVCNEKFEGVQQAASGLYYYFVKSGNTFSTVKNQIVGSSYYGPDGARVDNDPAIDVVVDFVNRYTNPSDSAYKRLEQAYNILYQYYEYKTNTDITARPDGRMLPGFVVEFFEDRGGNCFRFAASLAYIARVLGFDTGFISGQITSSGGGTVTHGLTEIYYNGTTYWCDAMMQTSYPHINSFWVTQSTYPYGYRRDYRIRMYVENGEVIWR